MFSLFQLKASIFFILIITLPFAQVGQF